MKEGERFYSPNNWSNGSKRIYQKGKTKWICRMINPRGELCSFSVRLDGRTYFEMVEENK